MTPQIDAKNYADHDSIVQDEVMNGLLAAKQYERNRPKVSPAVQEEMLRTDFPRISEGDSAKQLTLTEDECIQLRKSMQDKASETTTQSIANLRGQLTEYHSLLDKLGSLTARYDALEKKYQERGGRILSLEQEVEMLKGSQQQQVQQPCAVRDDGSGVRRISLPLGGVQAFNDQLPIQFQHQAPNNSALFQTNVPSFTQQHQASAFCNVHEPQMDHLQAQSPFMYSMNDSLSTRQHLSPSPRMNLLASESTSFHPAPDPTSGQYFPPGYNCNSNGYTQMRGLPASRLKRAVSNGLHNNYSGMMDPLQQQGNKRIRSGDCPNPYMANFHLPEAALFDSC